MFFCGISSIKVFVLAIFPSKTKLDPDLRENIIGSLSLTFYGVRRDFRYFQNFKFVLRANYKSGPDYVTGQEKIPPSLAHHMTCGLENSFQILG